MEVNFLWHHHMIKHVKSGLWKIGVYKKLLKWMNVKLLGLILPMIVDI